jgi:hypothetical protein
MQRLCEKIEAVEKVFESSSEIEQEIIKQYFWEHKTYLQCDVLNKKGEYLSERTIARKVRDIITGVGLLLGELEVEE